MTDIEFSTALDTATLHTVRIGKSRTITEQVFWQLDAVPPWKVAPWGRVRPKAPKGEMFTRRWVVGTHIETGELVRSQTTGSTTSPDKTEQDIEYKAWTTWPSLPLIILGGLR